MINMHMSASSFRLSETRIGERNYLGNDIHYPPDGRTGANCLLGTKVMIPIDGPVRENVGLLGSPAFEIPRMVERDKDVNAALSPEMRRQSLARKNGHNLVTSRISESRTIRSTGRGRCSRPVRWSRWRRCSTSR
jgi:non-ribosomal peptide synthetase-like protein